MIVIADTSPIHYLVLIQRGHLLESLYTRVVVPSAVRMELLHAKTPAAVRDFMQSPPSWIEIRDPVVVRPLHPEVGQGELAAINLGIECLPMDPLLILDDHEGRSLAKSVGLRCIGTLAVLGVAADLGLSDFDADIEALRTTNMRLPKVVRRL